MIKWALQFARVREDRLKLVLSRRGVNDEQVGALVFDELIIANRRGDFPRRDNDCIRRKVVAQNGLREIARYAVPTSLELEDRAERRTIVYRVTIA